MEELHVIGAGGHAKVVVALAQAVGYRVVGLYDDQPSTSAVLGCPVLGPLSTFPAEEQPSAVLAIGSNRVRQQLAVRWPQVRWISLVHPTAWLGPEVELGAGTVIMAGSIIQPGARLGQHVIVNTQSSVDHDSQVADYVHLAPGARLAGTVTLGEGVFLGVGSVVIPGRSIGAWTTVGAGAAVVRDLPAGITAVGVPARALAHTKLQKLGLWERS